MPQHPGILNVQQRSPLGALTGLEEAGDPMDPINPGILGIVQMIKSAPGQLLEATLGTTGRAMRGEFSNHGC